ncbi:hypothetical protein JHD53_04915 [Peptacetobacter hiranonis]|uniref:hypothetical protein n=1 Tax=Peptacetobacter hiranonis TaxID=89152 RepID=UPI00191750F3|nr:hypothetical protein [Peptacetobacter hiranonis]QQQ87423.1 hypothetical protein JHD53_04915 [Peptacetobacter hiranonis]
MTKMSILGKDNPFYKARIASSKESFKSRCDTAKDIFISRRRLEEIETGKREPYTDELLIMAEAYDAPYLVEHYCNHICKIGQKFGCKYVENKGDAYKATVMFIKSLKEAEQAKENILEILSDGEISQDEISMLDEAISKLNETMTDIINLKIALEKEKNKGGKK